MQLELKNLSVILKEKNNIILKNINYKFDKNNIHLILGANGAGKSSLAKAILKHPDYTVTGDILYKDQLINDYDTDRIARLGIFLSHQTPMELPGVNVLDYLSIISKKDIWSVIAEFEKASERLKLGKDFNTRSVNTNFSGGEKKKFEIIQMMIMNPELIILDEIDSGLDIETQKIIYDIINEEVAKSKTVIIITHNPNSIKYINKAKTIYLKDGTVSETGDIELARRLFDV